MRKKWIMILPTILLSIFLTAHDIPANNQPPEKNLTEQLTGATLWYQTSGEMKALYYQGYNLGRWKLDQALQKGSKKKPAVVLDIDETVLDNSPYQAMLIKKGADHHPARWSVWVDKAEAKALPGAIDFLKYADSKGVDIFYMSNRGENFLEATQRNLVRVGAPQATKEHIVLKKIGETGKEKRRQTIAKTHDILLLFGDNLSDFTSFDGKSVAARNQMVDEMKDRFGERFIVFPNPMYGDWERALYRYDFQKSQGEKDKLRKDHLREMK